MVMMVMKTFTKVFRCEGINNLYIIAAITKITGTFIDSCMHYLLKKFHSLKLDWNINTYCVLLVCSFVAHSL